MRLVCYTALPSLIGPIGSLPHEKSTYITCIAKSYNLKGAYISKLEGLGPFEFVIRRSHVAALLCRIINLLT